MKKEIFIKRLGQRISARWHMTLICSGTLATGVVLDRGFLALGLREPAIRYALSVLVAYAAFFLWVRLWLVIHFRMQRKSDRSGADRGAWDFDPGLDIDSLLSGPRGGPSLSVGQGGKFSGGGASGGWSAGRGPASGGGGFDLDLDLDDGAAVILVILLLVVAAVSGSAVYLIYQAPDILLEAAFELVLVAGLAKQTKQVAAEGWAMVLFKRTWIPFLVIWILMIGLGGALRYYCPTAATLTEYRHVCLKR